MAGSLTLIGKLVISSRTGIGNPCNVRASGQASAETVLSGLRLTQSLHGVTIEAPAAPLPAGKVPCFQLQGIDVA